MSGKSPEILQTYLELVEEAAEGILTDRQEIITLDRRRNTNREAFREMRNNPLMSSKNSWICVGNMFMRLPKKFAMESIQKEQKQLDGEILSLRKGLRRKINELNELEGKEMTRGTNLTALSDEEWKAVSQVLGS